MSELYVYYKLRPVDGPAARAAFEAARGDADVRLLQREDQGQFLTWMEVYGSGSAGLEPTLAAAMEDFAQGGRHIETFVPLNR